MPGGRYRPRQGRAAEAAGRSAQADFASNALIISSEHKLFIVCMPAANRVSSLQACCLAFWQAIGALQCVLACVCMHYMQRSCCSCVVAGITAAAVMLQAQ